MSDYILATTRKLGVVVELALTVLLGSIAVVAAGLGCEVAFSNMQTSRYSIGSIGAFAGYALLVVALPLVVAHRRCGSGSHDVAGQVRVASIISLVIELLCLPVAFMIFAM